MKHKLLVGSFIVVAFGLPLTASAADWDCFPVCAEPIKTEARIQTMQTTQTITETTADATLDTVTVVATREAAINADAPTSCGNGFMQQAEDLNSKMKPIKEIVGYVRSPQGLAIKLVNDHIVKIPAWIGYAMDPLGSLKRKAFDEVRTRAKDAMAGSNACGFVPEADFFNTVSDLDAMDAAEARRSI